MAATGATVPEHVGSPADSQFSARKEKVPIFGYAYQNMAPATKNWATEGFMSEIENQFATQCGSSWAFSTIATMEGLHAIQNGGQNKTAFSAQQLIDCDVTNNGCQGGWSTKGYAYTSKYGLMNKVDYPYTGAKGACQYDETKAIFKNTGMVQERYVSNLQLMSIVAKQPVSAGIVVTNAFRNYKEGILVEDDLKCSSEKKHINHQVTIVGYGETQPGTIEYSWCKQFWVARNSWGSSWGENGYFRLCMDGAGKDKTPYGTCQINRFPSYPTLQE